MSATTAAIWLSNLSTWPPEPAQVLATRFCLSMSQAREAVEEARNMKMVRRAFA
ncbi:hypothetical protein G3A56_09245 [Rhizobium oryzihabitans]|uniref:Uncharacterized protein n=1 Tax=Rhizobium oryzihabitans TaxID=2267833 RepID=A0A7L5BH52_9HYPH|nr:hypothetical protein [Rhizobium oryzihabitans]QIB38152.1 hypothetical protein G3A56_09245 [Rhizobium oryzihabitans]